MLWDEARIQSLVGTQDAWRAKYATLVHLHQRVDFAKPLILFKHGGIVIDPLIREASRHSKRSFNTSNAHGTRTHLFF